MKAATLRRSLGRRGVTLVELSVMLTVVAAMLGVCVVVLAMTMRLETDGRDAFDRSESMAQLAARFREDAHRARAASVEGTTLKLDLGAVPAIEYRADQGRISRVVVEGGKETARESYRIPQSVGAKVALKDEGGRRFASVTVEIQPRQDRIDPVRATEFIALVGKNVPPSGDAGGGKP